MFISFLIFTISFTSLHSMDNTTQIKDDWNLYKQLRLKSTEELLKYRQSHDINKAIDLAEYARDGHLMAKLIHICMPQELVREHIAPHLATTMATKYKHKIVSDKIFKPELINYNNEWSFFVQHDGNYFHVPKINNANKPYIQWDASSNHRKATITTTDAENKAYTIEKIFMHDKDNFSSISSLSQNKYRLYLMNHETGDGTTFACNYQTAKFIFSNDGSALAIHEAQSLTLNLYDVLSSDITRISLVAPITTLCTAHSSPFFAIGTNQPSNDFIIINYKTKTPYRYRKFTSPVISMEFSPDDTQLLACSNNEEFDTHQIIISNVKNPESLTILYNAQASGQILKAFFMNNGEQAAVIKKDGTLKIYNISNNYILDKYSMDWAYVPQGADMPLIAWSNKHKLLISCLNSIYLRKITTGKGFNPIHPRTKFIGLGLPTDENSIIVMDEAENAYQIELFSKTDCDNIDFIEKKANIIQLYEMSILYKQCHKSFFSSSTDSERAQAIIKSINSYIYEQQKD